MIPGLEYLKRTSVEVAWPFFRNSATLARTNNQTTRPEMGGIESCVGDRDVEPSEFQTNPKLSARTIAANQTVLRGSFKIAYVRYDQVEVGKQFLCELKTQKSWEEVKIVKCTVEKFKVHFIRHSDVYDEWIYFNNIRRLRPIKSVAKKKLTFFDRHSGECCICLTEKVYSSWLGCSHLYCEGCKRQFLLHALGDASQFPLKCPQHIDGCKAVVLQEHVQCILNPRQLIVFQMRNVQVAIQDAEMVECPFCHVSQLADGENKLMRFVYCPQCLRMFQNPLTISVVENRMLDDVAKEQGFQKCPTCNLWIEKIEGGCNHMTHTAASGCSKPRTDFCYLCGIELGGNFYAFEKDRPTVMHFPSSLGVFGTCSSGT